MVDFYLPEIVDVRHARDFVLWLRFRDGLEGEIDLGDMVRSQQGALSALADRALFTRVYLDGGSVAWPNGLDWAPETLYQRLLETTESRTQPNGDGPRVAPRDVGAVPEISRFFGIVIRMFFDDHARPHFHAQHGGDVVSIEIDGDGIQGRFPPSRLPLVYEWRDRHRAELLENWERLRRGEAPRAIPPLE